MKINGIKCDCGRILFSRARHDLHRCPCGKSYVDGGFDYIRCGWDPSISPPPTVEFELDVTFEQLYNDWNNVIDKFGTIEVEDQGNLEIRELSTGEK